MSVPSDEEAAEAAERLTERSGDGGITPPRPGVLEGELTSGDAAASPWGARLAVFEAASAGLLTPAFYRGFVRLVPSGRDRGGYQWERDASPDALRRKAPALVGAVEAVRESAALDEHADLWRTLDAARFWDALELMNDHGVDPATAHAGTIVCRECGGAPEVEPGGDLRGHLGGHDADAEGYRRSFPAAPVTADEAAALPPARLKWRPGSGGEGWR